MDERDFFASPAGDLGSGEAPSTSAVETKTRRAAERRQAAADWIRATTGTTVPCNTDHAFRSALGDGVVLVHLLNALRPGTIARVMERDAASPTAQFIRAFENVSNFLEAAKQFTAESFSAADLEDAGQR